MRRISVMLVDDHTLMRQGLRALLASEDDIQVVGEADSGEALLEQIADGYRPDVILIDIQMPGISGIEATRRLKRSHADVRVIGLTAIDDGETVAEMAAAGGAGYILKAAAANELVAAVRAVYAGKRWVGSPLTFPPARYAVRRPALRVKRRGMGDPSALTQREMEIMQVLAHGHTNKEIAEKLVISERTVQTHLSSIFAKLQVKSRTEAVLVAVRDGLPA